MTGFLQETDSRLYIGISLPVDNEFPGNIRFRGFAFYVSAARFLCHMWLLKICVQILSRGCDE